MANKIKLKRGSGSDPSASDLEVGELAIRTDSGKIFTKKDNGNVAEISGGGGIDDGDKGDITVSNGGDTFTIDSGVIDNANIASNAAIAGTKISANFGSQNIITNYGLHINQTNGSVFFGSSTGYGNNAGIGIASTNNFHISGSAAGDMTIAAKGGERIVFGTSGTANAVGSSRLVIDTDGTINIAQNLKVAGIGAFGTTNIDPDSYSSYSGGFGTIVDGSGWGARGVFVHGGGTGDVAAMAHNGSKLYFGIQNNASESSMETWLDVTPASRVINFQTDNNATNVQIGGNKIFHAGNDGAGSTLDADLLDGVQGNDYARTILTDDDITARMNSGFYETSTATTAEGWPVTSNSWYHLISSTHSNTGNYYSMQIAGDFFSQDNFYIRSTNASGTQSWSEIWTSSSDGSGSGLDADKLDGQEGSYYINASNLNAGTVAAARLDTATTQSAGNSTTKIATTAFVSTAISNLIDSSPSTLNTLNELAAALGDDANFSTTVTNSIATKLALTGGTVTGQLSLTNSSIYPLDINGSNDGKIVLRGSSNPYIRFRESNTDKAYIQWNSNGSLILANQESGERLDIGSGSNAMQFFDGSHHTVWHQGNDGAGSGLDADLFDGLQSTTFLRHESDVTTQDFNTFIDDTEAGWRTVLNHSGSNRPSSAYTYGTLLSFAKSGQAKFQLYAPETASGGGNTSNRIYYRTGWNTTYRAWARLLDSNDTGSGNGLDADTLDGVQAASFIRSDTDDAIAYQHQIRFYSNSAINTTTPYEAALEVFSGNGVGTDAFMAFHVSGDFAAYFGLDGGINDFAVGGWSMGANSYRVWHAGNDGSGSGLDADLLDGVQGSSFLRSDASDSATQPLTFSGGGGAVTIGGNSDIRLTSGNWTGNVYGKIQHHSNALYISGGSSSDYSFIFRYLGNDRVYIKSDGTIWPQADSSSDLGSSSRYWRNVYGDTFYGDGSNLTGINTDLVSDTSPQLGGTLDGNGQTANFTGNTTGLGLPRGSSAQAPTASSYEGYIRYDNDDNVVYYSDGSAWKKVSSTIPILTTIDGLITNGAASTLTLTGSGFLADSLTVNFSASGINANVTVTASSNSAATVTVPAAAYNASAGTVIAIKVTNADGNESGTINKTNTQMPTGGNITTSGNYRIHTFTSSGTFGLTIAGLNVEYLVVAGGGGGGAKRGGGGGAGGMISGTVTAMSTGNKTVTVGGGGGRSGGGFSGGNSGNNSVFDSYTAQRGGAGGCRGNGGSGGSGGGNGRSDGVGGTSGGSGTSGQGNNGGGHGGTHGGSGGGGKGSSGGGGGNGSRGSAGTSAISGTNTSYAEGGQGGTVFGTGGFSSGPGANRPANTGHGADGGDDSPGYTGGAGGSGIVIVRYQL